MQNFKNALVRNICLVIFPLFNLTILIMLWPDLFSLGYPQADSLEFRLLLIAPLAGGIGAQYDLLAQYCNIYFGCKNNGIQRTKNGFLIRTIRTIIGYIMGFLAHCFFNAGILTGNAIINNTNPYFTVSYSAIAGIFAVYIAPQVKNQLYIWAYYTGKLWQAFKVMEPPTENDY